MHWKPLFFIPIITGIVGCNLDIGESKYTLYRSSVLEDIPRIHVATFDAKDGEKYNSENCQIAADLFSSQPGVTVKYWCEKGKFRK